MAKQRLPWRHRRRDERGVVTSLDCGCMYDCHTGIYAKSCESHRIGAGLVIGEGNPFSVCPICGTPVIASSHKEYHKKDQNA